MHYMDYMEYSDPRISKNNTYVDYMDYMDYSDPRIPSIKNYVD